MTAQLLKDLANAKAASQQKTIVTVLTEKPIEAKEPSKGKENE